MRWRYLSRIKKELRLKVCSFWPPSANSPNPSFWQPQIWSVYLSLLVVVVIWGFVCVCVCCFFRLLMYVRPYGICLCLILLSIILLRCSHVVASGRTPFFLLAGWYCVVCQYHIYFTSSSIDGHSSFCASLSYCK